MFLFTKNRIKFTKLREIKVEISILFKKKFFFTKKNQPEMNLNFSKKLKIDRVGS
jgi:hypothetical protein